MVKRGGGTKRKVELKKITDKSSKAVTFSKRRDGLFSKAAQLCVLDDAQIAILATPSSSNSNVSFFSFGHSSVDSLVSAYLSGQKPVPVREESREMREDIGICMARKELGLGNWWEDEKLVSKKSPEEIMQAMESIKILLRDAERLLDEDTFVFNQRQGSLVVDEKKDDNNDNVVLHQHGFGKTLMVDDDDDLLPQTLMTTEWSDMDLDILLGDDDLHDEKTEDEEEDENHHHNEAVSQNYCSYDNDLLLPAAGGLNGDNDQNLFDLDLANVELDTIFEGLANLDSDLVASLLM